MLRLLFFSLHCVVSVCTLLCVEYYVSASTGSDSTGDGLTLATAVQSLQAGLSLAQANDTLWVAGGLYTGTSNEQLSPNAVPAGSVLSVRYLQDSEEFPEPAVLTAAATVLSLSPSLVSGVVSISGLSFQDSRSEDSLLQVTGVVLWLEDCIFANNTCTGTNGGTAVLALGGAEVSMSRVVFMGNHAAQGPGGALRFEDSSGLCLS